MLGAIAGGIAEAYYGVPKEIEEKVYGYLNDEFLEILARFREKYYWLYLEMGSC